MLTLEEVKKRLADRSISLKGVSNKTGLPYHTVVRIASNKTASPRYKDIVAISEYFEAKDRESGE